MSPASAAIAKAWAIVITSIFEHAFKATSAVFVISPHVTVTVNVAVFSSSVGVIVNFLVSLFKANTAVSASAFNA